MEILRILRSLEEFLYELVGWLVFYPRTFWRILIHPAEITRYTERELSKPDDVQFIETISPVLMLILSVVLAHTFELVFREPLPKSDAPLAHLLFGSEETLLLTRCITFCTIAFIGALSLLRQERKPVTRITLRLPFSIQAFLISPLVVVSAVALAVTSVHRPGTGLIGGLLYLFSLLWYVWARASAYRELVGVGWLRSLTYVCSIVLGTLVFVVGMYALIFLA